jgi:hypothetical protein
VGELTIAILLAFLAWVAWAMPLYDRADQPAIDGGVFWAAVAVGVIVSAAWWMIRYLARKAKG